MATAPRPVAALVVGFALALVSEFAPAAEPASPEATAASRPYVRVRRDFRRDPKTLETAVVRFLPGASAAGVPADLAVDLVAAIHVGDASYYQRLNRLFVDYDAVLYELIAEPDTPVVQSDGAGNPVRGLQQGLKATLGLDYQLEGIDYTARNFVHADLTPDEFWATLQEGGRGFLDVIAELLQAGATQAGRSGGGEVELLAALLDSERRPIRLKRYLAVELTRADELLSALDGATGRALIVRRNARAVDELQRQIALGRRRLAIFYGGGHMPDLELRLRGLGLERSLASWLPAWDLTEPSAR